jgi:hypothetical protein
VYQSFVSPVGARIMFDMNGDKTAEILKAGTSGFKSNIEVVLTIDFNTTNVDNYNVFDDFAYIQHDDLDLFVVSSSSDYKVAIVDMSSPNKEVSYVMLKDTSNLGRSRIDSSVSGAFHKCQKLRKGRPRRQFVVKRPPG